MRLTAEHGHAALEGAKRTHRTPARNLTPPHRPGDLVPLQFPQPILDDTGQPVRDSDGRPRRMFAHPARLRVQHIDREPLDALTGNIDALKAEGHLTLQAFALWWLARHDSDPRMRAAAERDDLTDPVDTWQRRHGHRPCWVVTFRVEHPDTIHLLAPVAGYTSSSALALPDEPEAVDPAVVGDLPASLEARQRWTLDRAERRRDRATMTEAELLAEHIAQAKARHIDIHGPLREIRRQMDRIGRRLDDAA